MDEGAALAGRFEAPSTNLAGEQGELKPSVSRRRGRQDGGVKLACCKQAAPTKAEPVGCPWQIPPQTWRASEEEPAVQKSKRPATVRGRYKERCGAGELSGTRESGAASGAEDRARRRMPGSRQKQPGRHKTAERPALHGTEPILAGPFEAQGELKPSIYKGNGRGSGTGRALRGSLHKPGERAG
jgi:hypothetical protein